MHTEFVLPATYEIRIRSGHDDDDQIWIEQINGADEPDDSVIVHRSQVDSLIAALQALMAEKP
jgi:hypothetical protein